MADLLNMNAGEWFLVGLTTTMCVIGLLLPNMGNLIGRAFLGEDPVVARWRRMRLERRAIERERRMARKAAKREAKAARRAAAGRRGPGRRSTDAGTQRS